MTLKECYESMGANYDEVIGRLRTDERVQKFLVRLPKDPSYQQLCDALEQRQVEEAFRAAHTLKGVSQNLALTKLHHSADILCEKLRGQQEYDPACEPMLAEVKADYTEAMNAIAQLS
jgi:HPt (histidine-containing phosphotransfer) domain-containing protein